MDGVKKKEIFGKIEELRKLAEETGSPLLLMMKENDEKNGRHLAAYGSGNDVKELIIDAVKHNDDLMKVVKVATKQI